MKKIAIFLLLISGVVQAKEMAFFCKWDTGDIMLEVSVKNGQGRVERTYDTDRGTVSLVFDQLNVDSFKTNLSFFENNETFTKIASCRMTTN